MKRWTDYYGGIKQVEVRQDPDGRFTGFHYCGAGVFFDPPRRKLGDGFYDTATDAVEGVRQVLKTTIAKERAVLEWLQQRVQATRETILTLEKRERTLEEEVQ